MKRFDTLFAAPLVAALGSCTTTSHSVDTLDQAIAVANTCGGGPSKLWQGSLEGNYWHLSRSANVGGLEVVIDRTTGKKTCSWYN